MKTTYWMAGILTVTALWARPAYAYIDAGIASMLFQFTIAGALGAMFTLKMFWAQVKAFFRSFGRKDMRGDE